MTHEKEICYWASHPDGTDVWSSFCETEWDRTMTPTWNAQARYIVDDEWTELRKANADGRTIQFKSEQYQEWITQKSDWWKKDFYQATKVGFTPDQFRVKPKEWYERIPEHGVLCRVWDKDKELKKVRVVIRHEPNKDDPFPFVAIPQGFLDGPAETEWLHAEPIRPDDQLIFKEDKEEAKGCES